MPLVKYINARTRYCCAYAHQSNYQMLYLLARLRGVNLCASRSALITYSGIDITTVRKLTDKALNRFIHCEKLTIDSALFISAVNLGRYNLDAPNKEDDSGISMDIGLLSRYTS